MLATIGKRFTFHAAHVLPSHDGGCSRLHGHTYTLEVIITDEMKRSTGEPDEGMVMDFAAVKEVYKRDVEPRVEHQFLNETLRDHLPATLDYDERELPPHWEVVTTCENMATWLYSVFSHGLPFQADRPRTVPRQSLCIRLWETPTSYAEVGDTPFRKMTR